MATTAPKKVEELLVDAACAIRIAVGLFPASTSWKYTLNLVRSPAAEAGLSIAAAAAAHRRRSNALLPAMVDGSS
uniref:Uncharacterized protein n=1 Tax=Triticum urartu TaxID=4572 RepID=A0A8R7Q1Y1_TRIUA